MIFVRLEKNGKMNEIDKLRHMLDEAHIPYESIIEEFDIGFIPYVECKADNYRRNQIIYGRTSNSWKLDAIWQYGSYGRKEGLLETYGELGSKDGDPMVMNALEAFRIISEDWKQTMKAMSVKHGHWIDRNDELFIRERTREYVHITTEVCSNCKELIIHAWTFGYVEYKYCPKCGAKMDEVEE